MSLIRKHGAVLQAWACLDLVIYALPSFYSLPSLFHTHSVSYRSNVLKRSVITVYFNLSSTCNDKEGNT